MDAIKTAGLSKAYGKKLAVNCLEMTVPEGAIYGFIGENGAGKSTTQKMICGLLLPSKGEISLFGKPANDAAIRERMGVLIENPGVYYGWTAQENLLMQAFNIGLPKPKETVAEALKVDWVLPQHFSAIRSCLYWTSPSMVLTQRASGRSARR